VVAELWMVSEVRMAAEVWVVPGVRIAAEVWVVARGLLTGTLVGVLAETLVDVLVVEGTAGVAVAGMVAAGGGPVGAGGTCTD